MKAFNSINHDYIQTTRELFNFGPQTCKWVPLFFSNREAVILMGGHFTKKVLLKQGVPQGDIISPFIFTIAVEILLIKITNSKNIKGIPYENYTMKGQTFADDTSITILGDYYSLRAAVRYINDFQKISGLGANKTKLIPFGKFFDPKTTICDEIPL